MRSIKRKLLYIFVLFLLVQIQHFWWNETNLHTFTTANETTNTSVPLQKNPARKLDTSILQFQWGYPVWSEDTTSQKLLPKQQDEMRRYIKWNMYKANFPEKSKRWKHNSSDLLCMLKNAKVELVNQTQFSTIDLNMSRYLPTTPLQDVVGKWKRCAVVSSSGSIIASKLGSEIDGHDAVMRINHAPTKGFEEDIGNKTTIRLFNSLVATVPGYNFLTDQRYRMGILVVFDPTPYHATLQQRYKKPEYNFWKNFKTNRMKYPDQPYYVINTASVWRIWDIIQANTLEDITPHPPSTGMIGIMLMMSLCDEINTYEFLPSGRKAKLCHYFDKSESSVCGIATYHPIIYEKNLIKQLNQGTDEDIFLHGKATLPGFSKVKC